ncbi:pyridoxamine 5'-phosphate oxidase family protein [Streptomyces sp. bgisy100]|uniref:pyridoxamine 5'-phosphate oxidase family protein n=1 Tax=Streptomyces sp. bgisy100 TaxID=3413783 RepID=UPI003D74E365
MSPDPSSPDPSTEPASPSGTAPGTPPGPASGTTPEPAAGPSSGSRAIDLLRSIAYGRLSVSMRALPFVTPARHIVADGRVLLRLHRGYGYHRACDGNVVAYGADNIGHGTEDIWSVQFTGTARSVDPEPRELALFGRMPRSADSDPFEPAYLHVEPRFITVHDLSGVPLRHSGHTV